MQQDLDLLLTTLVEDHFLCMSKTEEKNLDKIDEKPFKPLKMKAFLLKYMK